MITVIHKKPGELPEVRKIDGSLVSMQELVGGLIEHACSFCNIDLYCNEEGKILHLQPNIVLSRDGQILDCIYGDIFFMSYDEEEDKPVSISNEQMALIYDRLITSAEPDVPQLEI